MTITQLIETIGLLRRAREEAQRYAFFIQSLFRRIHSPLLILDDKGTIQQANPSALDTFGYAAKELQDTSFLTLCGATDIGTAKTHLRSALENPDQPQQWQARLTHNDGKLHAYTLSTQILDLDGGGRPGILLHCLPADDASLTAATLADAKRSALATFRPLTLAATIPTDRPILGKDLETLPDHLNCSITHCCQLLGIATMVWYNWRRKPDEPITSRTVALNIRLLDAFPMLAEMPYSPTDLHQALEQKLGRKVTLVELSLMLGMERASAYRWGRGVPPVEPIVCLIARLVELLDRQPVEAADYYRSLVDAEAQLLGIDNLWAQGSWKPGDETESKPSTPPK